MQDRSQVAFSVVLPVAQFSEQGQAIGIATALFQNSQTMVHVFRCDHQNDLSALSPLKIRGLREVRTGWLGLFHFSGEKIAPL